MKYINLSVPERNLHQSRCRLLYSSAKSYLFISTIRDASMETLNPGDIIEIRTVKETLQGALLESHEPGILLLKLKSGYNLGIEKEDITEAKLIKKAEEKPQKVEIKKKDLQEIDIIMTGGTISSRLDYQTGAVKSLTKPEELLKFYPEISNIANISIKNPFMLSSENMTPKEWIKIAELVSQSLNGSVQGVIVTHGTDTLHYTAAALSFFLQNLNKPLILTYSQRSSDRASSDANLNLICSAKAALSDIAEVMIVGHASSNDDSCLAIRGTKARKMHTSRRDAFRSINSPPLAKITPEKIEKMSQHHIRDNTKKVKLDAKFNEKTALIKFYPGQNPEILDYYAKEYNGIVLEMLGLGHVNESWLPKIKKAVDNGLVICAAPQTIYGRLNPKVYSPGRLFEKAGILFLEDMLPETAYVKLGWVLAKTKDHEEIKKLMLKSISGEISSRSEYEESNNL